MSEGARRMTKAGATNRSLLVHDKRKGEEVQHARCTQLYGQIRATLCICTRATRPAWLIDRVKCRGFRRPSRPEIEGPPLPLPSPPAPTGDLGVSGSREKGARLFGEPALLTSTRQTGRIRRHERRSVASAAKRLTRDYSGWRVPRRSSRGKCNRLINVRWHRTNIIYSWGKTEKDKSVEKFVEKLCCWEERWAIAFELHEMPNLF